MSHSVQQAQHEFSGVLKKKTETQKTERKKRQSFTEQIDNVSRQTEELKSTTDALKKQANSAYDKAEDLESDTHALVTQGNFLQKATGEKKKLVQELEEAEQLRKAQKILQYFTEKEGYFSGFVAFLHFLSST